MPPDTDDTLSSSEQTILLAGATGQLGGRIATHLRAHGAGVRALVRPGSSRQAVRRLRDLGVDLTEVDYSNHGELVKACSGCSCLVSALNGLEDIIVELQTRLLEACLEADVPRFIPSDYSIDYTKLSPGSNRNLDLRRQFNDRLDEAPISATSVLNGMFTDLLTGEAPVILFKLRRVLYWGNAEQLLDFTTLDDTAAYTARAALDDSSPRYLRIAGDVQNVHDLVATATAATGEQFRPLRAGSLGLLGFMITATRTLYPAKKDVFPPWQGMQYLHNMLSGKPKLDPLDNERYGGMSWTSVLRHLKQRKH